MNLRQALDDVVAVLEAGGVRAVTDARNVNPPCVLLRLPTLTYRFSKGYADAEMSGWCIVGDAGRDASIDAVSDLLTKAQDALNYIGVQARPDDAIMPYGATLPIYVLTWTQRIPA